VSENSPKNLKALTGLAGDLPEVIVAYCRRHSSLFFLVAFSLACLVVSTAGLFIDHRVINGEHAWVKPFKFSCSLTIYGLTLFWFSHYLTKHKHFFKHVCQASAIGAGIELPSIMIQVVRGTTSHFNYATTFDHLMAVVTVTAIMPVAFGVIALFVMLLREERLPHVLGLSLRWGVFITIIGFIPGVIMVLPERMQEAIEFCSQVNGHSVGLEGGGPGIPFLGWSTVAGDLRVAHFLGIHGLQALPFFGLFIERFSTSLSLLRQKLMVWNFGFLYLSFVLVLTWQALCTESIIAPSLSTMIVSLGVLFICVGTTACILWLPASIRPALVTATVDDRLE
jgi:hypothetical protein